MDTSGDKQSNLYPDKLTPVESGWHFTSLEETRRRTRWGYRICWSTTNYEWYPYLPAVFDWSYPIFRGVSPNFEVIHDKSGYKLSDEVINMWQNVEFIMIEVSKALFSRQLVPLEQQQPAYPSEFGYARGHVLPEYATRCARRSLNAFQRLLGYCAYAMAGALPGALGDHSGSYADILVSDLYKKLERSGQEASVLAKLLFTSLWRMRASRNHVGVVVNYGEAYDYVAVGRMFDRKVPVYVAWPSPGVNPYVAQKFPQHHNLNDFIPTAEHFEALERLSTSDTVIGFSPAANAATIRYGVPPAPTRSLTYYNHPMDYVALRLETMQQELDSSSQKQRMLDRLRSALKLENIGSAKFFRFDAVEVTDERTGQRVERWVRTVLSKADATNEFEAAEGRELWYVPFASSSLLPPYQISRFDCVKNEWSYSEHLNIKNNEPSADPEPPSNLFDEMEVSASVLEDGELGDSGVYDEMAIDSQGVLPVSFNNGSFSDTLRVSQFSTAEPLTQDWRDVESYLFGRYGLVELSGQKMDLPNANFPMTFGLEKESGVDLTLSELSQSFAGLGDIPIGCDLSPRYNPPVDQFPSSPPAFEVRLHHGSYLITLNDRVARSWKLLVTDPLTVIQIEREQLHSERGGLILGLVKRGLVFKILYPQSQRGTVFYPHPGPEIHPDGRSPSVTDYLVHRLDVAQFFKLYPHAYAAALCSGGILWRIAVDASSLPAEHDLARPFHHSVCERHTVDGQPYWSPKLTEMEEHEIVGIYKWAGKPVRKSLRTSSSQVLDYKASLRYDSWWPTLHAWGRSGLEFGAWAPLDEFWYRRRKDQVVEGSQGVVRKSDWKYVAKFQQRGVQTFLRDARSVAETFIQNRYL